MESSTYYLLACLLGGVLGLLYMAAVIYLAS
jgi:hypothetical protein